MIGHAKSISYGINDVRYITGESKNKEQPEKIHFIASYFMSPHLDALGIWNAIQLKVAQFKHIENSVIRLELSPAKEHTTNYTQEDWKKLWDEFIREFDNQTIKDDKGKVISKPTHLANSLGTVWLHLESDSGIPHLHAAYARLDNDGHTNNDHKIHLRAQRAAERVARRRGWITAQEIHDRNKDEVSKDCYDALKSMSAWSWSEYKAILTSKGYDVFERYDKEHVLRGYAIMLGRAKFIASELGVGRNLTAPKLEATWQKLHEQVKQKNETKNDSPKVSLYEPVVPKHHQPTIDYTHYHRDYVPYTVNQDDKEQRYYIPKTVYDYFDEEFDYTSITNSEQLKDYAVSIFIGLMNAQDVQTGSGGGGSQSDLPWRDKDDDDLEWARRCAHFAKRHLGMKQKSGYKRH